MKNPWMSAWLSAANQAAGASRGLWMAEAQRQQQAWAKEMTKLWMSGMPGAPAAKKASPRKRRGN